MTAAAGEFQIARPLQSGGGRSASIPLAISRPKYIPRPANDCPVSTSRSNTYDVSHAKTGSNENISAARVAVVYRCPHVCSRNATAVARTEVTASAITTPGVQRTKDASTNRNVVSEIDGTGGVCSNANNFGLHPSGIVRQHQHVNRECECAPDCQRVSRPNFEPRAQ